MKDKYSFANKKKLFKNKMDTRKEQKRKTTQSKLQYRHNNLNMLN